MQSFPVVVHVALRGVRKTNSRAAGSTLAKGRRPGRHLDRYHRRHVDYATGSIIKRMRSLGLIPGRAD